MPANKVIKLNAISRHTIDDQPYIVLDNQQDALAHVHRLALIPAIEKKMPDGSKQVVFPKGELQFLCNERTGLFPIRFEMQTECGYLVLALVPQGVITDFSDGGHFPPKGVPGDGWSPKDSEHDRQLVRKWVVTHARWVRTKGIIIYA